MFPIKRLYTFILQSFIPVFMMTFGICLFIVLMQFLWKYIEDFVGKGIDPMILAELFFYAALNLIPLALPLSILLASLMTFGNMGERLELLAVKASGVSLLKAMKPLIILMACISISAFFFQNEAMPRIGVKFRTLLMSVKQKSPELDIPEGSFYNGIDNYSIYVKKKNPKTGMLYNVMIYDTSKGFNDMTVFVSDSAKMQISESKDFLLLSQYNGQCFSSFREGKVNDVSSRSDKNVPYSRENFKRKDIIISFDANFNRLDESVMEGSQVSMNLKQLNNAIDSLKFNVDSLNREDRATMARMYLTRNTATEDTITKKEEIADNILPINFDSLTSSFTRSTMMSVVEKAKYRGENGSSTFQIQSWTKSGLQAKIRQYESERHRKFTLSFACLVFFFIGAPLGAIIRKGGLGMPVIVSVILFIVYYIFDNVGAKMARDGIWEIWQGMWLSSFVLFPLGVFLTYKAMNDSALFNIEVYGRYTRKLLKIKTKNNYDNEVDIDPDNVRSLSELNVEPKLIEDLSAMDNNALKDVAKNYKQYDYDENTLQAILGILKERGDSFFGVRIKNLNYEDAKLGFTSFFQSAKITSILYILVLATLILKVIIGSSIANWAMIISIIGYVAFYTKTFIYYFDFYKSIDKMMKKNRIKIMIGSFIFFIGFYPFLKKQMKQDIDTIKW